ncbi:hypothetical protein ANTPLA_LOCUS1919 [Anthophora plagiata]
MYADDIVICTTGSDIPNAISLLERTIGNTATYLTSLGLDICAQKMELIIFNGKNNPPGSESIRIGDSTIYNSPTVKFLGVLFDQKLKFDHHVNEVYGSKLEDGVSTGMAWFCPELERTESISVNVQASIFTAECLVVNRTLDLVKEYPNRSFSICTDSLACINTLQNPVRKLSNKYMEEILEKVKIYNEANHLPHKPKFMWVPAHTGLTDNEEVDKIAKDVAKDATTIPHHLYWKLPAADIRISMAEQMWDDAIAAWRRKADTGHCNSTGTKYFSTYFQNKKKPWFDGIKLPRNIITWVCRARANHHNLGESLHKINLTNSPMCQCGTNKHNFNHILWQCTLLEQHRKQLTNDLRRKGWQSPWNIETFLSKPCINELKIISRFLQKYNISI